MSEETQNSRGLALGLTAVAVVLVMCTFVASVYGAGVDEPPKEKERTHSVRPGGGAYLFFYSSGPGVGARGVGGARGFTGGGYGSGK